MAKWHWQPSTPERLRAIPITQNGYAPSPDDQGLEFKQSNPDVSPARDGMGDYGSTYRGSRHVISYENLHKLLNQKWRVGIEVIADVTGE